MIYNTAAISVTREYTRCKRSSIDLFYLRDVSGGCCRIEGGTEARARIPGEDAREDRGENQNVRHLMLALVTSEPRSWTLQGWPRGAQTWGIAHDITVESRAFSALACVTQTSKGLHLEGYIGFGLHDFLQPE